MMPTELLFGKRRENLLNVPEPNTDGNGMAV